MTGVEYSNTKFLQVVFGQHWKNAIVCGFRGDPGLVDRPAWRTKFAGSADLDGSATSQYNWYYTISLFDRDSEHPKQARRRKSLFREMRVVVIDDVGTGPSAKVHPTRVWELLPEPTFRVETSPGNEQWGYVLREPETDIDRASGILTGLVRHNLMPGGKDPGMTGVTRLVRMPFAINGKEKYKVAGKPFQCRLREMRPRRRYTIDELAGHAGIDLAAEVAERWAAGADGALTDMETPELKAALPFLEVRNRIRPGVYEIRCPRGEEHTDGGEGDGTALFVGESGLAIRCHHGHGDELSTAWFRGWLESERTGTIDWPTLDDEQEHEENKKTLRISPNPPLPALLKTHVYVSANKRILDLTSIGHGTIRYSIADFTRRFCEPVTVEDGKTKNGEPRWRRTTVGTLWTEHPKRRVVHTETFDPGLPPGVVTLEDGRRAVNTYAPIRWAETDELPTAALEHIEFLLPTENEREYFLDWLAAKVQHPEVRLPMVLMTTAAFGVGRSTLGALVSKMFSPYCITPTWSRFSGRNSNAQFNSWMAGTLMAVIDETRDGDEDYANRQQFEHLKATVDTDVRETMLESKGSDAYTGYLYHNVLAFSNHLDAVKLPPSDRRVNVFENPEQRAGLDYYKRIRKVLLGDIRGEAGRLWWYLQRRQVDVESLVLPLNTPARMAMIDLSRSPAEELWQTVVDTVPGDVITERQAREWLNVVSAGQGVKQSVVDRAARMVRTCRKGVSDRVKYHGRTETFWVIRRQNEWIGVHPRFLRREADKNENASEIEFESDSD